jgi:hypothetical protein
MALLVQVKLEEEIDAELYMYLFFIHQVLGPNMISFVY